MSKKYLENNNIISSAEIVLNHIPTICKLVKKYYDETKKNGFSDSQAIELTISYQNCLLTNQGGK